MPRKDKKKPSKARSPKKSAATADSAATKRNQAATKRFLQDLATRGEAVELPEGGKLPSQATHVVTKKNPDGTIQVKRVRFKLF